MKAWLFALGLLGAGCRPAALRVVAAEHLGQMPKPGGIDGRDGGTSGRLGARSLWVYGDSVTLAAGTYPSTWRNNTMSYTDDLDASDGISGFVQPVDSLGAPREFFPRTPDEQAFNDAHQDSGDGTCASPCGARYAIWGSGPISAGARTLLTYAKVYSEPGPFNFHIVGSALAVLDDVDLGPSRPDMDAALDDPKLLFGPSDGEFGIPVSYDGALYLFSCSGDRSPHGACRLGRAPVDEAFHRSAWTFAHAGGWSKDVTQADSLFDGSPNMTVHWNPYLSRWLAIYASFGHIVARTATELGGPWSDESTLDTPSEPDIMHALGHVEYQAESGTVEYISYLSDQFHLLRIHFAK